MFSRHTQGIVMEHSHDRTRAALLSIPLQVLYYLPRWALYPFQQAVRHLDHSSLGSLALALHTAFDNLLQSSHRHSAVNPDDLMETLRQEEAYALLATVQTTDPCQLLKHFLVKLSGEFTHAPNPVDELIGVELRETERCNCGRRPSQERSELFCNIDVSFLCHDAQHRLQGQPRIGELPQLVQETRVQHSACYARVCRDVVKRLRVVLAKECLFMECEWPPRSPGISERLVVAVAIPEVLDLMDLFECGDSIPYKLQCVVCSGSDFSTLYTLQRDNSWVKLTHSSLCQGYSWRDVVTDILKTEVQPVLLAYCYSAEPGSSTITPDQVAALQLDSYHFMQQHRSSYDNWKCRACSLQHNEARLQCRRCHLPRTASLPCLDSPVPADPQCMHCKRVIRASEQRLCEYCSRGEDRQSQYLCLQCHSTRWLCVCGNVVQRYKDSCSCSERNQCLLHYRPP